MISQETAAAAPRTDGGAANHPRLPERPGLLHWLTAYGEAGAVCLLAPALIFPNRLTPFLLPLFPILWLIRWHVRGRITQRTPLDAPTLLLLLMLMVSLYPSIDLQQSMPKYLGILLSVTACSAVVNTVSSRQQALVFGWLLLGLGGCIALLGLVGTDWFSGKLGLVALTSHLPHLITRVISSQGVVSAGFHPNVVAGTLVLFLPLGTALVATSPRRSLTVVGTFICALMASVLFLTQSRSGFMGTTAGLIVIAFAYRPRLAGPVAVTLLAFVAYLAVRGAEPLLESLFPAQAGATIDTWRGRVEIWQRAWYMIQDFPFTGVGLNTFPKVVDLLYPLFQASTTNDLTHAHNLFLETAVDMGVPGLLAFLGILGGGARSLWRAWALATDDAQLRGLALGLIAGILAHLVFGLTDAAVTLGGKSGAALWLMLGLGAALGNVRTESPCRRPVGRPLAPSR